MLAIIPAFNVTCKKLLTDSTVADTVRNYFSTILDCQLIEKTIVITDCEQVYGLSRSLHIESFLLDVAQFKNTSSILPYGSEMSIQYLVDNTDSVFNKLIIFGFWNPLLTSDLIDKAIAQFEKTASLAVISVKGSKDHPCQLNRYLHTSDAGIIHMLEHDKVRSEYVQKLNQDSTSQSILEKYKITKPFYFEWDRRGIGKLKKYHFFKRMIDGNNINYTDLNPVSLNGQTKWPAVIWVYENKDQARILVAIDKLEYNTLEKPFPVMGISFTDDYQQLRYIIYHNRQAAYLKNMLPGSTCNPHVFRYLTINSLKNQVNNWQDIEVEYVDAPVLLDIDMSKTNAIIFSIDKIVKKNSVFDRSESFPNHSRLWALEPISGEMLNLQTHKMIKGRQDFPDVFEPEGSFIISEKRYITAFDQIAMDGKLESFPIPGKNSIQVKSELDYWSYKALIKANQS